MDLARPACGGVAGRIGMSRGCPAGALREGSITVRYVVAMMAVTQLAACSMAGSRGIHDNYWPGSSWRTSTPEARGMDSGRLLGLFAHVADADIRLHHLSIVRNGYLVLNADFYPYRQDWPHDIVSGTKSVTSTLVGIAHQRRSSTSTRQSSRCFPTWRRMQQIRSSAS